MQYARGRGEILNVRHEYAKSAKPRRTSSEGRRPAAATGAGGGPASSALTVSEFTVLVTSKSIRFDS
jgi:hypothetical protein